MRRRRRPAGARAPGVLGRDAGRRQRPRAGLQRPPRRQARRHAARRRRRRAARRGSSPRASRSPGAPVKTTIDTGLQESAVSALAGRSGGIAVLDARNGDVRALAGQAFSAPQPPGLHLQDDHDHRRPAEGRRLARRLLRNHQRGQRRRPLHRKRQRRVLRRHLPRSLRRVLQRRLRPARARRSATTTWSRPPKRFGFNSPPTLYAPEIVAEVEPAGIEHPDRDRRRTRPRRQRDRPGRSAGDAAADGERRPDDRQRRRARADLDRRQQASCAPTPSRCG